MHTINNNNICRQKCRFSEKKNLTELKPNQAKMTQSYSRRWEIAKKTTHNKYIYGYELYGNIFMLILKTTPAFYPKSGSALGFCCIWSKHSLTFKVENRFFFSLLCSPHMNLLRWFLRSICSSSFKTHIRIHLCKLCMLYGLFSFRLWIVSIVYAFASKYMTRYRKKATKNCSELKCDEKCLANGVFNSTTHSGLSESKGDSLLMLSVVVLSLNVGTFAPSVVTLDRRVPLAKLFMACFALAKIVSHFTDKRVICVRCIYKSNALDVVERVLCSSPWL